MKFYSYDYVLSQISQQNWVMVIMSILLVLVTAFLLLRHLRINAGVSSVNYQSFLSYY